jgi:hypothetical protein
LETEPGKLLKLAHDSDLDKLKSSIESGEAHLASGHLVSLIALKYRSLSTAPRALITNEIQSSLSALYKSGGANGTCSVVVEDLVNEVYESYLQQQYLREDAAGVGNEDLVVASRRLRVSFMEFVAGFVERIPIKMAAKMLFPFVLDPVVKLSSNHAFKKQVCSLLNVYNYYRNKCFKVINSKIEQFMRQLLNFL